MVWGDDKPIDTTTTTAFDRLDSTMEFTAVGDEDLAGMGPTQTLTDQPAKHLGSHRRPRRGLTWRGTVAAAVLLGGSVFAAVWVFSEPQAPASGVVRQAAPDAPVATTSLTPTAKPTVKRPVVLPAEPVVRRQDRAAPVMPSPVHTVTVTVTAKPPTPKPSSVRPPTPTPSPDVTSPEPTAPDEPTPTVPDGAQTTATETPDDDA